MAEVNRAPTNPGRTTGDRYRFRYRLAGRGPAVGGRRAPADRRPLPFEYRALLDAEDLAFDELEHACEEGDRTQFDKDMIDWRQALEHKIAFLTSAGIEVSPSALDRTTCLP